MNTREQILHRLCTAESGMTSSALVNDLDKPTVNVRRLLAELGLDHLVDRVPTERGKRSIYLWKLTAVGREQAQKLVDEHGAFQKAEPVTAANATEITTPSPEHGE